MWWKAQCLGTVGAMQHAQCKHNKSVKKEEAKRNRVHWPWEQDRQLAAAEKEERVVKARAITGVFSPTSNQYTALNGHRSTNKCSNSGRKSRCLIVCRRTSLLLLTWICCEFSNQTGGTSSQVSLRASSCPSCILLMAHSSINKTCSWFLDAACLACSFTLHLTLQYTWRFWHAYRASP